MANKPITMSKLRQVLRFYCQGQSKLKISSITKLSRNTVIKYINTFTALKTTWEEINRLPDKDLDELFCKEPEVSLDERLIPLHEFFKTQEKQLRQRGVTLLRLWEQYQGENHEGYKMTSFYNHYRLWKRRAAPSMHMTHKAGEKMFVDYTGEKLEVVDPASGELKKMEVFVAILGASQLTYVEAVESQRVEDFIGCCENALHYFGGAPNAIVPDNLKSAVIKTNRYEPKLNENFEAFADYYGMVVLPARAYKPKDKALVEGAVKITYIRIFASLPKELPTSLQQLNGQIRTLLDSHNAASFKGRNYSRKEQFEEMEKATLHPLPQKRFELRSSSVATVMKNGHVCLGADKHYYSVPFDYISKKIRILYSKSTVEIFYKYQIIATHVRLRSAHNYTTDPSHMATQHKVMAEWNPDYFLAQARTIGKEVEFYIAIVLQRRPHPEQAYKSCQGILSFAKRVGHQRLIKACVRGHAYGLYHYRAIEDILQKGLDLFDLEEDKQLPMPFHENIRGKNYYQ
jgi:transposase